MATLRHHQPMLHSPWRVHQTVSPARHAVAGALAGQVAGLIMAAVVMFVFTVFLGRGPLFPVQVIGSFIHGDAALYGLHAPAFFTGLVLHQLGPSLFWGIAFGLVVWAADVRRGISMLVLGLMIGVMSQIVDVDLVLPRMFAALHGHDIWAENVPEGWSFAAHLVYGLSLATFPGIYRALARPFHRSW